MMLRQNKWVVASGTVVAFFFLLASLAYNIRIIAINLDQLGDFGSFLASGIAMKNGDNPYDASSPLIFEATFPRFDAGGKMPNLNPPISLLAFERLPGGNYLQTLNVWRIVSFLLYLASLLMLMYEYRPGPLRVLWAFALAGLWHTIGLGQLYALLLLLTTLAWLSLRHHKPVLAGIFLGLLVSIKPNFAVWVLLFVFQKNWKTVFSTITVTGLCALIPLLRMPANIYIQWLEATRVNSRILIMPGNSSLVGLTSRMGIPQVGAILGILLLGIVLLSFFRAKNTTISPDVVNATGILLSLLLSPISWIGYTILMLPFFLSEKEWGISILIAAAILAFPFNFVMHFYYNFGRFSFIFWGWWYGIALALCSTSILGRLWRGSEHVWLLEKPQ